MVPPYTLGMLDKSLNRGLVTRDMKVCPGSTVIEKRNSAEPGGLQMHYFEGVFVFFPGFEVSGGIYLYEYLWSFSRVCDLILVPSTRTSVRSTGTKYSYLGACFHAIGA
jgi:hypothetical protein